MKLEELDLTETEKTFLLAHLKTALFDELEPMRLNAVSNLLNKQLGKYIILGATVIDFNYILNTGLQERKIQARAGPIPELYQNQTFFPFGEL